jgi:hypothetical protein
MTDNVSSDVPVGQDNPVNQDNSGTEKPRKRNPPRGFNDRIGEAELLAEAMAANQEELTPAGGGEAFVNELKQLVTDAKKLNQKQERNKAELKESTEEIRLKMKDLDRKARKGRNIVKNEVAQERWVEFGILATK